jgi:hypothetical protein
VASAPRCDVVVHGDEFLDVQLTHSMTCVIRLKQFCRQILGHLFTPGKTQTGGEYTTKLIFLSNTTQQ